MRLRRELELAPKAAVPTLEKSLAEVEKKVAKYDGEKAEIQKEAAGFEEAKAEAQKHGAAFGLAVIFLQIGILLSSIAALLKQKPVYYLGLRWAWWASSISSTAFISSCRPDVGPHRRRHH